MNLQEINIKLDDIFGRFNTTTSPRYRLVWSPDQIEKRIVTHTASGVQLLHPEVSEVPKYKQWADECYILEVMTPVPLNVETDLISNVSYEPLWVFRNINHIPSWEAVAIIIETREHNMSLAGAFVKYKEKNETKEELEERLRKLQLEIFGNETEITDALAYQRGVSYAGLDYPSMKDKGN